MVTKRHLGETLQSESTPTRTMGQTFGGQIEPFDSVFHHISVLSGRTNGVDRKGLGEFSGLDDFERCGGCGVVVPENSSSAAAARYSCPSPAPNRCMPPTKSAGPRKSLRAGFRFLSASVCPSYKCQNTSATGQKYSFQPSSSIACMHA